jgi:hypothetical protein
MRQQGRHILDRLARHESAAGGVRGRGRCSVVLAAGRVLTGAQQTFCDGTQQRGNFILRGGGVGHSPAVDHGVPTHNPLDIRQPSGPAPYDDMSNQARRKGAPGSRGRPGLQHRSGQATDLTTCHGIKRHSPQYKVLRLAQTVRAERDETRAVS